MKGIGKKKTATVVILTVGFLSYVLQQFGENILGSFYKIYLAPWLEASIHYVFDKELVNKNWLNTSDLHQIHILWILLLGLFLSLVIVWITGKYYSAVSATRITQEKKLSYAMQAMIRDEEYIQAAQLYRYEISNEQLGGTRGKRIIINHLNSHYKARTDINAVVHEEFFVPEKTYRLTKDFSKQINKYEKTRLTDDKNSAAKIVERFIIEKKKHFQSINKEDIGEEDCIDFIIYKGIQSVLGLETLESRIGDVKEDVFETLLYGKRTGCLPAILLQSVFLFRNGQSIFKKDRAYWSFSPNKVFLPRGYKDVLIVLTIPYDHIKQRDERFLYEDLVLTVNSFLEDYVNEEEAGN